MNQNQTESKPLSVEEPREEGLDETACSAGPLTAEMIREMLGHIPFDVGDMPDRWEWMANYLNETLRDPGVICPCCNITRDGQLMDHLPPPPRPSLPNVKVHTPLPARANSETEVKP
jgi:hypothetical protein